MEFSMDVNFLVKILGIICLFIPVITCIVVIVMSTFPDKRYEANEYMTKYWKIWVKTVVFGAILLAFSDNFSGVISLKITNTPLWRS